MKPLETACNRAGLKMTDQRRIILQIISEATDHPSVDMVYERARQRKSAISVATVYRTLNLLEDLDIVMRHEFGNGCSRYEINSGHHDHLIRVDDGQIIEFYDEELERLK